MSNQSQNDILDWSMVDNQTNSQSENVILNQSSLPNSSVNATGSSESIDLLGLDFASLTTTDSMKSEPSLLDVDFQRNNSDPLVTDSLILNNAHTLESPSNSILTMDVDTILIEKSNSIDPISSHPISKVSVDDLLDSSGSGSDVDHDDNRNEEEKNNDLTSKELFTSTPTPTTTTPTFQSISIPIPSISRNSSLFDFESNIEEKISSSILKKAHKESSNSSNLPIPPSSELISPPCIPPSPLSKVTSIEKSCLYVWMINKVNITSQHALEYVTTLANQPYPYTIYSKEQLAKSISIYSLTYFEKELGFRRTDCDQIITHLIQEKYLQLKDDNNTTTNENNDAPQYLLVKNIVKSKTVDTPNDHTLTNINVLLSSNQASSAHGHNRRGGHSTPKSLISENNWTDIQLFKEAEDLKMKLEGYVDSVVSESIEEQTDEINLVSQAMKFCDDHGTIGQNSLAATGMCECLIKRLFTLPTTTLKGSVTAIFVSYVSLINAMIRVNEKSLTNLENARKFLSLGVNEWAWNKFKDIMSSTTVSITQSQTLVIPGLLTTMANLAINESERVKYLTNACLEPVVTLLKARGATNPLRLGTTIALCRLVGVISKCESVKKALLKNNIWSVIMTVLHARVAEADTVSSCIYALRHLYTKEDVKPEDIEAFISTLNHHNNNSSVIIETSHLLIGVIGGDPNDPDHANWVVEKGGCDSLLYTLQKITSDNFAAKWCLVTINNICQVSHATFAYPHISACQNFLASGLCEAIQIKLTQFCDSENVVIWCAKLIHTLTMGTRQHQIHLPTSPSTSATSAFPSMVSAGVSDKLGDLQTCETLVKLLKHFESSCEATIWISIALSILATKKSNRMKMFTHNLCEIVVETLSKHLSDNGVIYRLLCLMHFLSMDFKFKIKFNSLETCELLVTILNGIDLKTLRHSESLGSTKPHHDVSASSSLVLESVLRLIGTLASDCSENLYRFRGVKAHASVINILLILSEKSRESHISHFLLEYLLRALRYLSYDDEMLSLTQQLYPADNNPIVYAVVACIIADPRKKMVKHGCFFLRSFLHQKNALNELSDVSHQLSEATEEFIAKPPLVVNSEWTSALSAILIQKYMIQLLIQTLNDVSDHEDGDMMIVSVTSVLAILIYQLKPESLEVYGEILIKFAENVMNLMAVFASKDKVMIELIRGFISVLKLVQSSSTSSWMQEIRRLVITKSLYSTLITVLQAQKHNKRIIVGSLYIISIVMPSSAPGASGDGEQEGERLRHALLTAVSDATRCQALITAAKKCKSSSIAVKTTCAIITTICLTSFEAYELFTQAEASDFLGTVLLKHSANLNNSAGATLIGTICATIALMCTLSSFSVTSPSTPKGDKASTPTSTSASVKLNIDNVKLYSIRAIASALIEILFRCEKACSIEQVEEFVSVVCKAQLSLSTLDIESDLAACIPEFFYYEINESGDKNVSPVNSRRHSIRSLEALMDYNSNDYFLNRRNLLLAGDCRAIKGVLASYYQQSEMITNSALHVLTMLICDELSLAQFTHDLCELIITSVKHWTTTSATTSIRLWGCRLIACLSLDASNAEVFYENGVCDLLISILATTPAEGSLILKWAYLAMYRLWITSQPCRLKWIELSLPQLLTDTLTRCGPIDSAIGIAESYLVLLVHKMCFTSREYISPFGAAGFVDILIQKCIHNYENFRIGTCHSIAWIIGNVPFKPETVADNTRLCEFLIRYLQHNQQFTTIKTVVSSEETGLTNSSHHSSTGNSNHTTDLIVPRDVCISVCGAMSAICANQRGNKATLHSKTACDILLGLFKVADRIGDDGVLEASLSALGAILDGYDVAQNSFNSVVIWKLMQQNMNHSNVVQAALLAINGATRGNTTITEKTVNLPAIKILLKAIYTYSKVETVARRGCTLIANLSSQSSACQGFLGTAGGCNVIVDIMKQHGTNVNVQREACWAICNMSQGNAANRATFGTAGAVERLGHVFKQFGDLEAVLLWACGALANITAGSADNANACFNGNLDLEVLNVMKRYKPYTTQGAQAEALLKYVIWAIGNLSAVPVVSARLGSNGACEEVAAFFASKIHVESLVQLCCTAIKNLCSSNENMKIFQRTNVSNLLTEALKKYENQEATLKWIKKAQTTFASALNAQSAVNSTGQQPKQGNPTLTSSQSVSKSTITTKK